MTNPIAAKVASAKTPGWATTLESAPRVGVAETGVLAAAAGAAAGRVPVAACAGAVHSAATTHAAMAAG